MSFDKILDLTAEAYFNFYNIYYLERKSMERGSTEYSVSQLECVLIFIIYIVWNVRVWSDFMLARVDEDHSWITEGIHVVVLGK